LLGRFDPVKTSRPEARQKKNKYQAIGLRQRQERERFEEFLRFVIKLLHRIFRISEPAKVLAKIG
jgi:hypothetical protein